MSFILSASILPHLEDTTPLAHLVLLAAHVLHHRNIPHMLLVWRLLYIMWLFYALQGTHLLQLDHLQSRNLRNLLLLHQALPMSGLVVLLALHVLRMRIC